MVGGVQRLNHETAEREARRAAESGNEYDALMAEGARYGAPPRRIGAYQPEPAARLSS